MIMEYEFMLTTNDNPYDPFDQNQFNSWLLFDKEKGYNCCERLARIAQLSDDLTEKERAIELEKACDLIIENDVLDIYKKVTKKID